MRRVLFDSDILLDVLAQRQPFVVASAQALNSVTQEWVEGYVSGHAITNIFYILRRQIGSDAARKLLSTLLERIQVASVTDEVIRSALQSSVKDFEDAVTSEAALAAGLQIIITRNIADGCGIACSRNVTRIIFGKPIRINLIDEFQRVRSLFSLSAIASPQAYNL